MATTTATRPAKKSANRSTRTTGRSSTRVIRGNSDARDAVMRAAEQAKEDGYRSEQAPTGVKMVDRGELVHLVDEMPDEYVQCRTFGHGRALANYENKRGVRSFTLYCPTCKFARHMVIDRHGDVVEDKPDWPEGYLLPKGSGRIGSGTKGVLRLASIDRTFNPSKKGTRKK